MNGIAGSPAPVPRAAPHADDEAGQRCAIDHRAGPHAHPGGAGDEQAQEHDVHGAQERLRVHGGRCSATRSNATGASSTMLRLGPAATDTASTPAAISAARGPPAGPGGERRASTISHRRRVPPAPSTASRATPTRRPGRGP